MQPAFSLHAEILFVIPKEARFSFDNQEDAANCATNSLILVAHFLFFGTLFE